MPSVVVFVNVLLPPVMFTDEFVLIFVLSKNNEQLVELSSVTLNLIVRVCVEKFVLFAGEINAMLGRMLSNWKY